MKRTILLIEDNEPVRRTARAMLVRAGYEVTEAADGREGFKAFLRARYDLVITDVIMPGQEGIETIQRIRELDPDVPILAISGSGTEEFSPLHDAEMMGANRILGKPFEMEQFLSIVASLVA